MIENNILAYKIVQSISLNLFIIVNEYASKTFGIPPPFFFGDMSNRIIVPTTQMIYGRLIATLSLF
jgi:hypothetical protein